MSSPTPNDKGSFGRSVDTDGNLVVVGAPFKSTGGAAYVFDLKNPQKPIELKNPDAKNAWFGGAVAVDGGLVAVGSPYAKTKSGGGLPAGAVYLFDVQGKLVRTIENPAPLASIVAPWWMTYGFPLSLRSGVLLVGDPFQPVNNAQQAGIVYVYDPPSTPAPNIISNPSPVDWIWFGHCAAVGDTFIAVNAWDRNHLSDQFNPKNHAGAVTLFSRPTLHFACLGKNPSSDSWNAFATGPVSADGNTYVVGAWGETVNGVEFAGAIYIYHPDVTYQYYPPDPIPIVPPDIFQPHRVANRRSPRVGAARPPRRRRPG